MYCIVAAMTGLSCCMPHGIAGRKDIFFSPKKRSQVPQTCFVYILFEPDVPYGLLGTQRAPWLQLHSAERSMVWLADHVGRSAIGPAPILDRPLVVPDLANLIGPPPI